MTTFYIACAVLGGVLFVLQSVSGLFEDGDADGPADAHMDHGDLHEALDIISFRTLSAGVTAFGITGGLLQSLGLWWVVSLPGAGIVGFSTMYVVAKVISQMRRLESEGALVLEGAIGEQGTVYIPIPGEHAGRGKVTTVVQSQLVELEAVTPGRALATGEKVLITDFAESVAVVVPMSSAEGASYVAAAG